MQLLELVIGKANYEMFSDLSSRKKIKGVKEDAKRLLDFANQYRNELEISRKILKTHAPESKHALDIRWRYTEMNNSISNIEQLMIEYDKIFSKAKQRYYKLSDEERQQDEPRLILKFKLDEIVNSLETEFGHVIDNAKAYHQNYYNYT